MEVTVTPRELLIQGSASKKKKGRRGNVHLREFTDKQIFRRYELPSEVDVDHVRAKIEDGILLIDLPKVARAIKPATEQMRAGAGKKAAAGSK